MFADLLIFMLGGSIGFFAAALCKAASRADERIEQLQMSPHALSTVENIIKVETIDLSEDSIENR